MGRKCKSLELSQSSLKELEELAREAKSIGAADLLLRIRGIVMVARAHSYRETGRCLGVTLGTVSHWVNAYEQEGQLGLLTKPRTGRPAELTEEELLWLDDLIDEGALASGFPNDLWDARRVSAIIGSHFRVSYHPHHVARLLRMRGFSVQKPHRVLALADAVAQDRWEIERQPQIARRARQKKATIFFEDEMTLATQGTVGYTWARVGRTPDLRVFGRHKGVKAFGAVSAQGGFRYRVQLDYFSQGSFRTFLTVFRAATDGHLLVIIDGAPYHKGAAVTDFIADPRNEMELFHLPAYSPDLNPQEHVWKVFRKQHTHNRSFSSTTETLQAARSGFRSLQHSSALDGVFQECRSYFDK